MEIISEETGDSPKQVQRYIKMADLIPELLEKVDLLGEITADMHLLKLEDLF